MDRRAFFRTATPKPAAFLAGRPSRRPPRPPERPAPRTDDEPLRPLGIRAGLEPYAAPLDRRRAAHLLRRLTFGAPPDQVNALVGLDAADAVTMLLDDALNAPVPEPYVWIDEAPPRNDRQIRDEYLPKNEEWQLEFRADLHAGFFYGGLRERLTLFWSNHFVTELEGYAFLAVYSYRYVDTLRQHALGNFKTFVHAIGLDPAMLFYLNGTQNRVGEPNENYGRELLELFTMGPTDGKGQTNYTQQDVEEIARALTGWVADPFTLTVQLVNIFFDDSDKTIFGRTGNWGYDDVIDILFEERAYQIGEFIGRKLYEEFVYAAADEALVAELAQVFVDSEYELLPVLQALFASAHFHDEEAIGAQIKSPVEMLHGMLRELHVQDPPEGLFTLLDGLSFFLQQYVLSPPNVAGWEGHRAWLNTTTLPIRWLIAQFLIYGERARDSLDLRPLAEVLLAADDSAPEPARPESFFALALAMARHLMPVPLDALDLNAPDEDFAGDLDGNPLPAEVVAAPQHEQDLAKIFLAGVPWYEWNLYLPEAGFLLSNYARYLTALPEFQLT